MQFYIYYNKYLLYIFCFFSTKAFFGVGLLVMKYFQSLSHQAKWKHWISEMRGWKMMERKRGGIGMDGWGSKLPLAERSGCGTSHHQRNNPSDTAVSRLGPDTQSTQNNTAHNARANQIHGQCFWHCPNVTCVQKSLSDSRPGSHNQHNDGHQKQKKMHWNHEGKEQFFYQYNCI